MACGLRPVRVAPGKRRPAWTLPPPRSGMLSEAPSSSVSRSAQGKSDQLGFPHRSHSPSPVSTPSTYATWSRPHQSLSPHRANGHRTNARMCVDHVADRRAAGIPRSPLPRRPVSSRSALFSVKRHGAGLPPGSIETRRRRCNPGLETPGSELFVDCPALWKVIDPRRRADREEPGTPTREHGPASHYRCEALRPAEHFCVPIRADTTSPSRALRGILAPRPAAGTKRVVHPDAFGAS